jgi:hypothetical protein
MTALVDNAIRHARSEVRLSVTVASRRALVTCVTTVRESARRSCLGCSSVSPPACPTKARPTTVGVAAWASHWSARSLRVTAGR